MKKSSPSRSKKEIISLQKQFVTDEAIGAHLGVTRQAIHQWRNKYGIPAVTAKNASRNKTIATLIKKGARAEDVAAKYGLSISQVYRIIR